MDIILLLKYIILGMIQGFTEPLPISSSGHLVIFQELFNIGISDLNFEILVNAGSLIAIIIIFQKDILLLIKNSFLYLFKKHSEFKKDFLYVVMLLVAVIPAGIIGLLFENFISSNLKSLFTVGVSLLITAVALSFIGKQAVNNTVEEITFKDAIIIGLFQVVALVPGISRSGSTMFGGLFRKIKFEDTMRFSFLLYIPISLATIFLKLLDFSSNSETFVIGYITAFILSIITTYFAVKWFFKIVRQGNLKYFSIYCTVVGSIVVILSFFIGGN